MLFRSTLDLVRALCDVTLKMIEGELYQLTKNGDADITEDEHFEIIRRKTAYLFGGCGQIGAMLGVYEKSVPRLMLGLKALNRPEDAPFIASFPMEVQRLISHGFGRLLYFNSKNLDEALRNIKARTFLDTAAAVQGMAFGYTMVNHEDLSTVLATGGSLMDAKLIAAFQAGLIYALMFWEWCWPGFLNTLTPPHAQAGKLIAAAQREIADAKQAGALPPFRVSQRN